MVADTGATGGIGRLRQLNQPRPATVQTDADGVPVAVESRTVEAIVETWRIEDEWWRAKPIRRIYWRLLLDDGRTVDVFRDHVKDGWYRQVYSR